MNVQQSSKMETIEIKLLLEGIYQCYGLDFRDYAMTSIRRRILYRMKVEKIATVTQLLDRVLHDPKMMEKLYFDFSINVSEMFRDPSFFLTMRKKILPKLAKYPLIRIWHAGCSTGEEVYSMAILLKEEGLFDKSRIYATDINERVLEAAKKGEFPLKKMQDYTNNYVNSGGVQDFSGYYTVQKDFAKFDASLSKNITFAQHNLVTDGSFNEFHMIICRNVLIYFNRSLQERVHSLFFHSLSNNGFLGLGSREGLLNRMTNLQYQVIDNKEKIYQKDTGV
ncbi:chemotaxis protein R [Robertmurraya siralis]|uniref:Chemotaxis protein R n=2 Tax=Bacillaceae TaxID=186817 RepID=A0A919WFK7_9BACI|nr:chemotaxis protein CheR [Bacillus sp. 7504-2]GIN61063.1 chemotaxis protein R [Robertmurraya siralis]